MQAKKKLRSSLQAQRNAIPKEEKISYDQAINQALLNLIESKNYQKVHAYLPMGSEVNIRPLLEKLLKNKIKVYTPKTLKNRKLEHLELHCFEDLETGLWGTQHPKNSTIYKGTFDLIIVPGLGFDLNNNRLGYGGGYYDNFMAKHRQAYKVAVAYPFQIMDNIPTEEHDEKIDKVLFHSF